MDLSIIITEYFCLGDLQTCLESIATNIHGLNYEIIVSSNSTYSETERKRLLNEFPYIKWVFNGKNLGYAKAVNMGIKKSAGNYLFILNPDTFLMDNNISQLLRYIENNPDVGIVGPKLIDGNGKIQDSCRPFITPKIFVSRVIIKRFLQKEGKEILEKMNYDLVQTTDWVSGACMLVRRKAIEKVGLMDERYFMYCEDMDLCKRFWDNGFKIIYWPYMTVCHNPSRHSSDALSNRMLNKLMWIHLVSYLKFFWKFFPRSLYLKYKNYRKC